MVVETNGGYARILVSYSGPTTVAASISGRVLTLRLERPIQADLVALTRKLATYVSSIRRERDQLTYRFALGVPVRLQTSVLGGRTAIDLVPENYAGMPAPLVARVAAPQVATAPPAAMVQAVPEQALSAQGAVAATAGIEGDRAVLRFPQSRGGAVAVFERGVTTWIVLDRHPPIDATPLFANLAPLVTKAQADTVGDSFVIRLRFQSPLVAVVSEDETALVVAFAPQGNPPQAASLSRATAHGLPQLRVQLAGATPAIALADPDAGDRVFVVPARPGAGVPIMRRFVELEMLPSTAGIAVVPRADDLTMSVKNGLVDVTRPSGMFLSLL
jgi:hypothetical protein